MSENNNFAEQTTMNMLAKITMLAQQNYRTIPCTTGHFWSQVKTHLENYFGLNNAKDLMKKHKDDVTRYIQLLQSDLQDIEEMQKWIEKF